MQEATCFDLNAHLHMAPTPPASRDISPLKKLHFEWRHLLEQHFGIGTPF